MGDNVVMSFGILGCGYVSDSYIRTANLHPDIKIVGVYDREVDRARKFSEFAAVPHFESMEAMLASEEVEAVINLTNPREHLETTRACLEAGKHVYTEKPLGMGVAEAKELAALASSLGLQLATAPCSVLSPAAQTLWKAIRDGLVGKVRMVYANFDDGMIAPHMAPWTWCNEVGMPWPAKDEFEVGCTYEHAGYYLSWLCSYFGAAKKVNSFASTQIKDKGIEVDSMAPDFTCACIEFENDVVARVTCGLVAPLDKSMTIVGDDGVLYIENLRDDLGDIWYSPRELVGNQARIRYYVHQLRRRLTGILPIRLLSLLEYTGKRRLPLVGNSTKVPGGVEKRADFLRGPSELAAAVREGRMSRLPAELGIHMVEIIEKLQYPSENAKVMESELAALEPLWK